MSLTVSQTSGSIALILSVISLAVCILQGLEGNFNLVFVALTGLIFGIVYLIVLITEVYRLIQNTYKP